MKVYHYAIGLAFILGIVAVIIGAPIGNWAFHGNHSMGNLFELGNPKNNTTNSTANVTDANLSLAKELESKANATLRNADRDLYYAKLGMETGNSGNPESAKMALEKTKEAGTFIDNANVALKGLQGVKGTDAIYMALGNDSTWITAINKDAVDIAAQKPKYGNPAPTSDVFAINTGATRGYNRVTVAPGANANTSGKPSARGYRRVTP